MLQGRRFFLHGSGCVVAECKCGKILFTFYGTGPFWGPSGAHAAATLAAACSARAQQLHRPQIPDAVGGGTVEYWPQMWPTPKNGYD